MIFNDLKGKNLKLKFLMISRPYFDLTLEKRKHDPNKAKYCCHYFLADIEIKLSQGGNANLLLTNNLLKNVEVR